MKHLGRRALAKLATGAPLVLASHYGLVSPAAGNPVWEPWRDLLNFLPREEDLAAARKARQRPPLQFAVQRIETAKKPLVNLDRYEVRVTKLPTKGPAAGGADTFYRYVRRNFNDFLKQDLASFGPHLDSDRTEWDNAVAPPLGCMMVFSIQNFGAIGLERGAVTVSAAGPSSWRFSTVTIGSIVIGTHPVAGNREFGLRPGPTGSYVFYTQAADRAFDNLPSEDTVLNGAKELWQTFQTKLSDFVQVHGGQANVVTPTVHQPRFVDVKQAGVFTRV